MKVVVRPRAVTLVTSRRGDPGPEGPSSEGISEEEAQALVDVETGRATTAEDDLQAQVAAAVSAAAVETAARQAADTTEAAARAAADTTLQTNIASEATARADADASEAAARSTADALLIPLTQKAAPNGVATLDASTLIPDGQIPSTIARDTEVANAVAAEAIARDTAIAAAIAALINSAPGALDTLDEIAAALGDDADFAAAVTAALAAKQPLDADLTAIAALTTTAFGRALLEIANAAGLRTAAGLGTAAVANTGDFDAAGAAAAAQAAAVQRANHTGTQTAATISDLVEAVQDILGALAAAGNGLTLTYNDAANTWVLDVNVDNASLELNADAVRVKAGGITNAMLAGSIALAKLATDPLARANHTGTQTLATISDAGTAAAKNSGVANAGDLPTRADGDARYAPFTPTVGSALGTTGSVALDFSTLNGTYQTQALSGNITYTTANLAAGRTVTLKISAASTRTLTFPAGWVFLGAAAPAQLAAGKTAVLTLTAFGTTDADVVAAYSAQP